MTADKRSPLILPTTTNYITDQNENITNYSNNASSGDIFKELIDDQLANSTNKSDVSCKFQYFDLNFSNLMVIFSPKSFTIDVGEGDF